MRLAALLLFVPLAAAAQNNDVSLFLGGAHFESNTIIAFAPEEFDLELAFENGRSSTLNFNHFWRENVSTEFGILGVTADPTFKISSGPINASFDVGDARIAAFTATGQYHFRRYARVSPYIGAGIALVSGELEAELEDEFGEVTREVAEFEAAGAILFNAGLNIRINDRWIFAIDVKAIPYSPELEEEDVPQIPDEDVVVIDEVDLNPVIVGFGVRYRF